MTDISFTKICDEPTFSIRERDHRWARLRQLMEHDGVDVVRCRCLPCSNTTTQARAGPASLMTHGPGAGYGGPPLFLSAPGSQSVSGGVAIPGPQLQLGILL